MQFHSCPLWTEAAPRQIVIPNFGAVKVHNSWKLVTHRRKHTQQPCTSGVSMVHIYGAEHMF